MKISHYTQGLGVLGKKMYNNIRLKHKLVEVRDLLMLRIISENWEDMIITRKAITDLEHKDGTDPKLHMKNKQAQSRLMTALKQVWWRK